jgi:hypothetical protein
MFLPDVEEHPRPGAWADNIRALQAAGKEYPQIWHMFACSRIVPMRPIISRVSPRT